MGYLKMFCLFFKIRDTFLDVFLSLISDVTPLWPGSISCVVSTLFSGLSPLFLAGHMPRGMFHKHLEGTRPLPCCAQRPRRAGRGEGPWPAAAPRPPSRPPPPGRHPALHLSPAMTPALCPAGAVTASPTPAAGSLLGRPRSPPQRRGTRPAAVGSACLAQLPSEGQGNLDSRWGAPKAIWMGRPLL